ncbi:UDP-N-acetylmuramoylalanine--D-glutamate ligase [compost metagenome]
MEWVATIDDVEYFDDSKGTNVGATVAALSGLDKRVVLIAGGEGKGQDFSPLAAPVAQYARAVVLIGRAAAELRDALQGSGATLADVATLEEAVARATELAERGDVVLLSPACASLDMFRNYVHRAEVFRAAVEELALSRGILR